MNLRFLRYLIFNSLFAMFIWLAYFQNWRPAQLIVAFLVVFFSLTSLLVLNSNIAKVVREQGPPCPPWLDQIYDVFITLVLVGCGHPVLGTLYILHSLILHSALRSKKPTTPDSLEA